PREAVYDAATHVPPDERTREPDPAAAPGRPAEGLGHGVAPDRTPAQHVRRHHRLRLSAPRTAFAARLQRRGRRGDAVARTGAPAAPGAAALPARPTTAAAGAVLLDARRETAAGLALSRLWRRGPAGGPRRGGGQ